MTRKRGFRAGPMALTLGTTLIFCAADRAAFCQESAGTKATKDGAVTEAPVKKKRKPLVIDNTKQDRTPPPVVFETWPLPELTKSTNEVQILPPAQPAPDLSEQLRALEMPQSVEGKKLYSFRSENLEIKTALALFARANNLNIVPDLNVTGQVTLDVHDLSLERMLQALLEANDYAWTVQDGLIRVHATQTRTFVIDYLRMIRNGIGSSTATLSGGSTGGGAGGGQGGGGGGGGVGGGGGGGMGGGAGGGAGGAGGGAGGSISGSVINVNQNNPVDFWKDLDEELSKLVTEAGKATLAINKTSGIIEVSDRPSAIKRVERFLASLSNSVHRQVEIEVKMYDVTLRDQFEFGINWERLARAFGGQFTVAGDMVYGSAATGVTPVPGSGSLPIPNTTLLPNTAGFTGGYRDSQTSLAVKALQEQGDVKVISQPRIRVLNNQTALIKVGTDTPFFAKNVQTINTGFGTSTAIAVDSYQLITIGTILSLTPQISSNNIITLDVSPVITTLVNTHVSASGETTAPEMEIKQASSIVRLNDGETVVLGGLIQNRNVKNTRRIPLVSDIPGFGQLFTGRMNQKEKRELVMFITPKIVRN